MSGGNFEVLPVGTKAELERLRDEVTSLTSLGELLTGERGALCGELKVRTAQLLKAESIGCGWAFDLGRRLAVEEEDLTPLEAFLDDYEAQGLDDLDAEGELP